MAPFFNLLLSLFNVFFFHFQPPASGEISQSLLDLCLLNFVFVLFFVKIFPRPFAELSPVIVLFFCFVCVFVCLFFTVSTSSMALFAQHQSLLFFLLLLCVRIFFPSFSYSTVSHSICFSVYWFALKLLLTC